MTSCYKPTFVTIISPFYFKVNNFLNVFKKFSLYNISYKDTLNPVS